MNCNQCNSALEDDALYCPVCGDQFAANNQKTRVNDAFAKTRNIVSKQSKSPVFLAVAILFTVITATQMFAVLRGGIGGILPLVFMIIGTIGFWGCYMAKNYKSLAASLRKASIYDAYIRVLHTVGAVLLSIVGVLSAVSVLLIALLGEGIASFMGFGKGSELVSSIGIATAIVVFVVFAIIIAVVLIFRGIYAKRRKYFLALSETVETCNYAATKAPVKGSYILGGFNLISAIFSIGLALSARSIVSDTFAPMLPEFGLTESVDALIATFTSSLAVSGVSSIISGAYLILSALWMFNVHKEEAANKDVLIAECARLEEIEKAVRDAAFAAEVNNEGADKIADNNVLPVLEEITVEDAVEELTAEEAVEESAESAE